MASGTSSTGPQNNRDSAGLGRPPSLPSGKSSTSPPKVAQHEATVELQSMKTERSNIKGAIRLGEDIMQIARIGEISVMQKLFDEKKFTADYKDEEGITPLHVCSILLKNAAQIPCRAVPTA